ncbi:MAG: nitrilase-related carbon-nitrogen hydrolase [Acidobacteriota bacterium]
MQKPNSEERVLNIIIGTLISAAAFFVSIGLGELWPFAWIAPIPVLILAFNSSARTAAIISFLACLLGSLNQLTYLLSLLPIVVVIITLLLPAIIFSLAVLVTRQAVLRLEPWLSIFALPAIWTSYEWLLSIFSPHGTAGSLAYTQTDVLPLLQIASLTGLWGITFVLLLIPSGLAVAWHFRAEKQRAIPALALCLAIGLLTLVYGWVRLSQSTSQPAVRVGLAATDETIQYFRTEQPQEALPVVEAYAHRIAELAKRGAQVVVLPEKFVGVTPSYAGDVLRILGEAARSNKVTVVAGLNQIETSARRNTALVFSPDGKVVVEYDKVHLVPGWESRYQVGLKPGLFSMSAAVCGVAICKDMDFPDWTRAYTQAGAGLLVVPAWDFVRDARWHARMAIVRGVEGGFAVARSAQEGLLTVSDHYGRLLAEEISSRTPEALLVSEVSPGPGRTLYSTLGNWFGWSNLLLLALIIIKIVTSRRS